MKWQQLSHSLYSVFNRVHFEIKKAKVLVSPQPVDLHRLLLENAGRKDERQELEDEGVSAEWPNPASALSALASHWRCPVMKGFEWDSFGPISSGAALHSLQTGDGRTYILACLEGQRLAAIAAIQPGGTRIVWPSLFLSLLKGNGNDNGVGFFGSLPTRTINCSPRLIPANVVFDAYWNWMQWATKELGADVWTSLRNNVSAEFHFEELFPRSPLGVSPGYRGHACLLRAGHIRSLPMKYLFA